MKTKQKAEYLIESFRMDNTSEGEARAIKCALICIDEILDTGSLQDYNSSNLQDNTTHRSFWQEVRNEIAKLL
jgi:hypothetical protein